jgi:hypothetical protein
MPKPSRLGTHIEQLFADGNTYVADRAGHSQYLLRYRTPTGVPFAIGRTTSSGVRFWLSANEQFRAALETAGYRCVRSEPSPKAKGKRGTGRNSNLDAIPEFKDKPLFWTRITTAADAATVAALLR